MKKNETSAKGTVRKSYEVIMARGKYQLELQDMRLFIFLLHQSYGREDKTGIQFVPVADVLNYLGHRNLASLERSLRSLSSVKIEIDYEEEGQSRSVSCHFLSYDVSRTTNGTLEYAFDSILMRFIFEPKIYAKINMALFQQFKTTQGAKLFEIMSLFHKRTHRSWLVTVDEFRARLGIADDQYERFDNLRRSVIDRAVNEVNRLAPFGVVVDYIRGGRGGKVVSMEFKVVPRNELPLEALTLEKARKPKGRDPQTVDMLTGHTDEETGRDLLVPHEAMQEALQVLEANSLGDADLPAYLDEWRETARQQKVTDPGAAFLQWLRLRFDASHEPDIDVFDADILENLLTEFE
ncbi:RepB family plasmid replication initiator protein [Roseivivax sp. CAU 1761]